LNSIGFGEEVAMSELPEQLEETETQGAAAETSDESEAVSTSQQKQPWLLFRTGSAMFIGLAVSGVVNILPGIIYLVCLGWEAFYFMEQGKSSLGTGFFTQFGSVVMWINLVVFTILVIVGLVSRRLEMLIGFVAGYAFIFSMTLIAGVALSAYCLNPATYGKEELTIQSLGINRDQALVFLGDLPDSHQLDPATTYGSAGDVVGQVFSGLVRLTPQIEVVPDLAENWQVSPDGSVYTFTMRSGAAFASGKPITAQDVKDSWERAADPQTHSYTASGALSDILGANEYLNGKASEIRGVGVLDKRTLVVRLDSPKAYFLAKLSMPTFFIIDKADSNKLGNYSWESKLNASGPYKVKEYRFSKTLVLERNARYHTPARIPYVLYQQYLTQDTLSMFEVGEIDLASIERGQILKVLTPGNKLRDQMKIAPTLCSSYLLFNNQQRPLNDLNVRKALAQSIDRAWLKQNVSDNLDLLAEGVLPPAMPGFISRQPQPAYDPQAARAALANSKYAGKLPVITLTVEAESGISETYLNSLITMWSENLGVRVITDTIPAARFMQAIQQYPPQILVFYYCPGYPDPKNLLENLFYSQSVVNYSGYSNPEVDALLVKARGEQDPQTRMQLYQQAEKLLLEDYAVLPLLITQRYTLVNPAVKGYVSSPMKVAIVDLLSK
jgi:oligopeptide transport system substrate-binding protein